MQQFIIGDVRCLLSNGLGSIRHVVDEDGQEVDSYEFDLHIIPGITPYGSNSYEATFHMA